MPSSLPPSSFGIVIDALLEGPLPPLDAGVPTSERRERLASLTASDLCGGSVHDRDAADACLAALWLRNGFLEESHTISQHLSTREGSWWHGIMHRREGDFDNATYWFRRVGDHPLLPRLGRYIARLVPEGAATGKVAFLGSGEPWDPCRFTSLCAMAATFGSAGRSHADAAGTLTPLFRRVADAEWRMLFAECLARACGSP